MNRKLKVMVAGRSSAGVAALQSVLSACPEVVCSVKHLSNGHADPLHGVTELPDALIFHAGECWEHELTAIGGRPPESRPPCLVVGPASDPALLRAAMKAGARDVLTEPVDAAEMLTTLTRLARERAGTRGTAESRVTAVMNAKGGSGATLLACNLAHLLATHLGLRVGLMDLDLQFGTLPLYLDLERSQGLIKALAESHELDAISLDAMAAKHASGVRVFGAMTDEVLLPNELDTRQLDRVLRVALSLYDHVVVDLPRQIEPVTTAILERADTVLLIMQQNVAHLRDAKRLVAILVGELQVAPQQIQVLVNRYQPRSMVALADIERALGDLPVHVVPNDFKLVGGCVDLGLALAERNRKAALTQSLARLAELISGRNPPKRRGLFSWRRGETSASQVN